MNPLSPLSLLTPPSSTSSPSLTPQMAAEVTNTIRAAINTLRNLGVADSDTDDYRTAHATALESFASSVASRVAGVFRAASADVAAAADLGGRGRELRTFAYVCVYAQALLLPATAC